MPVLNLQFDPTWLTLVALVLLPSLTGFVTQRLAHPGLKAGVLAVLVLITSAVNEALAAGGILAFDVSSFLAHSLILFLGAVATHYGLLKPVGLTGGDGAIARAVPAGIGGVRASEDVSRGDRY